VTEELFKYRSYQWAGFRQADAHDEADMDAVLSVHEQSRYSRGSKPLQSSVDAAALYTGLTGLKTTVPARVDVLSWETYKI
jgi:hypothetical protein